MTKGLATLTMLLVCTVCLVLVLGPYYAIYGGVALVGSKFGERRIWGRFETTDPKIFSDPGWIASGVAMTTS